MAIFYLYPRIFYLQARAARRGRKASKIRTSGDSLRTGWAADPAVVETAAPYADFIAASLAEAANWLVSA